jgi:asparagine synthase (glutamine-hydrolysing)
LAVVGGRIGVQPFLGGHGRIVLLHNGEVYNYKQLRSSLEAQYTFASHTDSEVLAHLIGDLYDGDLTEAVEGALARCDGVYAIAVTDGQEVVIGRDLVGVRQLYVGRKGPLFCFSSEKKALWALGIQAGIERLLPGQLITASPAGTSAKRLEPATLIPDEVSITDANEALSRYRISLETAVAKRIQDQERVGVIFSGGIDSVLIAQVAVRMGANVTCYSAGYTGASDLYHAHLIAGDLGMSLRTVGLVMEEIEELIPSIIGVIEDHSLGQVETAVPVFAAVQAAHREGQRVLLSGQGADELFGGYPWYRAIVEQEGYAEFQRRMKSDLLHLYKETLEREDKITMSHSIELRVPYLDLQVITTAMSMAPQLKVTGAQDTLGKHVHRELARTLDIPRDMAVRPKEAAQHGAGIHDLLDTLATSRGFSAQLTKQIGYSAQATLEERLGSSARYGYLYGQTDLWADRDHVQLYLDTIAYRHGLLSPAAMKGLQGFIEAAEEAGARVTLP